MCKAREIKMENIPIKFPRVFENILNNLDINSLKNCRLVNKTWNTEAIKLLANRCEVRLAYRDKLIKFHETFLNANESSVKFKSFQFPSVLLTALLKNTNGLQNTLEWLRQVCGENLTDLWLAATYQPSLLGQNSVLHKMIYQSFPNMSVLKLTFYFDEDFDHGLLPDSKLMNYEMLPKINEIQFKTYQIPPHYEEIINEFVKNLLSSCPNLRTIETAHNRNFNPIVANLPSISSKLTSLSIDNPKLDGQDLKALIDRNFPKLNTLEFRLDPSVGLDIFNELLGQYSNTLKKFSIISTSREPQFPDWSIPGVFMRSLQTLSLANNGGLINWKNVPNLEKLEVSTDCMYWQVPERHLPKLTILDCITSDSRPETIPDWFSRLSVLDIRESLPEEVFRNIFAKCHSLRKLRIDFKYHDVDEVISGLSPASLNRIQSRLANLKRNSEKEVGDLIELAKNAEREAFIGDLKELQELILTFYESDFTDLAVLCGIVLCEKLRKVEVKGPQFGWELSWRSKVILNYGLKDLVFGCDFDEDEED